jgi:hypothetical protein
MSDDTGRSSGENSAAIDAAVVERVAEREGVDAGSLAEALVVVGADLTDAHHEYEREFEYAAMDDARVYGVDGATWDAVAERNDLGELSGAVREAHREQADVLLEAVPETPLVVGVDTAEEVDPVPGSWRDEE